MEDELKKAPTTSSNSPIGGEKAPTGSPIGGEVAAMKETATAEPLKGRAAFIDKLRALDAELKDDISDDDLFDRAGAIMGERDEIRGKYDALNGANEKLAAVVSENPEVAQFISMLGNGENWVYAIGKSFGNVLEQLDDATLEQYNAGKEEYKAKYNQMKENFAAYESRLKTYAEKNGLTPEQVADVNNTILDIAEALYTGDIPEEVIDNVFKGMDYDNEKTAEVEAAKLAGRNEAIDEIKGKKAAPTPLPDLTGNKSGMKQAPAAKARPTNDAGYVDLLADSEKIS